MKIENGRSCFYQWDLHQRLIVEGYPEGTEVHFAMKNRSIFAAMESRQTDALVVATYAKGGQVYADVPNILLQEAGELYAYIYVDGEHTAKHCVFTVIQRKKPADYVYTETEVKRWEDLEARLLTLEEDIPEPLIGESTEIKPSQVQEAMTASRDVLILHTDKTFGLFYFTSFDINVSLNLIFTSSILQYNGMYAVVELIGDLFTDTWQFIIQQIPIMSDIPAPVIGTTAEVTPSQVKALMDAGKPFAITHADSTYGAMLFNGFVYSQAVGILSTTVFQVPGETFCAQLIGDFSNDTWEFSAFTLATTNDIPTKTSQLTNDSGFLTSAPVTSVNGKTGAVSINIPTVPSALPNPATLTINGTSYDGSKAVDMTEIINAMIDAKLVVIENGSY